MRATHFDRLATRLRTTFALRVRTGLALAGALSLCAGCQSGEFNPEAKDSDARVEHYETSAVTYYDGGKYSEAERMFAALVKEQPRNKKARRGLARSKLMQGTPTKLREAQALFEDLVKLPWHHKDRGDISYEVESDLATTFMQRADLYDRDVRELDSSLRNEELEDRSEVRRQLQKQVQTRNELLYKAIPVWQSVLKKNPDNPYALSSLSKAHLQLGNASEGVGYAEQYLALSQKSQVKWRDELDDHTKRVGKENVTRSQRQQFIAKAQGAREKEKKMHLLLASVHMRREEYDEAVKSYTEVIRIDSAVPAAYIERAQAYAAVRRYSLAVDDIEQYLKITDPQMHRRERVSAGELLLRYRAALARGENTTPYRDQGMPRPTSGPYADVAPYDPSGMGMQPVPANPTYPTPTYDVPPMPQPGSFPTPAPTPGAYDAPPPPGWEDPQPVPVPDGSSR